MKLLKVIVLATVFLTVSCKTSKYTDLDKGLYADIETNRGDILVKLHQDDTPLTVANFVSLAEGTNPNVSDSLKEINFYDGLKFHRVLKNFMIQGGDPAGVGSGGPGYKFEDEFPKDSLGKLVYTHNSAGVLSMANSGPGTNGSQFFITHKDTPWLNGKHTIFGKVEKGQNVVDSIAKDDVINHVSVIRIGREAKNFDAAKVFTEELKKSIVSKEKKAKQFAEKEKVRYEKFLADKKVYEKKQGVKKAKKTASGLKIVTLKKGRGKKVTKTATITVNYTLTLADGKIIQTTVGKKPFVFVMEKQPMIPGFTEGILKMRTGGKSRLFIPYYLAWGEKGTGPFPPKADVIFELEVLKVGK
ncbi:MAG: peptidylprolyl isomerase [Polaribacter sp.]|nr:peptidylprolyl isomerase [Polaribacter sp.]